MALMSRTFRTISHAPQIDRFLYMSQSRLMSEERATRDSCAGTERPACAPCPPRAPPACRRAARACPRALRVTCCAPPAAQRPPCAPPPPACPLTCSNAPVKDETRPQVQSLCQKSNKDKCGAELDHVARRLAIAEQSRREEYEREVSEPKPAARPQPAAYHLSAERQCVRATDGRDYMHAAAVACAKSACGPGRSPPPPQPMDLMSSDGCEIKSKYHLDPCSHRPRIVVDIDRSASIEKNNSKKPKESTIKQRLMDSLNFRKNANANTSCPRQKCRKLNDWCNKPPALAPAPPRCREPTLAERLQQRSQNIKTHTKRELHTSVSAPSCSKQQVSDTTLKTDTKAKAINDKTSANINKLIEILEEKHKLKESGRGRLMGTEGDSSNSKQPNSGSIELRVPPHTEAVKVRVTLDFNPNVDKNVQTVQQNGSSHLCMKSGGNKSETWLSIKNIQKKLTGCGKKPGNEEAKSIPANPCVGKKQPSPRGPVAGAGPRPCAPAAPAPPADKRARFTTDINVIPVCIL